MAIELTKLRLDSGFTQSEYESLTGIKQSYLSLLENASTNPQLSTLIKIAQKNGYRLEIKFKKT
jgi:DNA-binding helix-turn-helix protein